MSRADPLTRIAVKNEYPSAMLSEARIAVNPIQRGLDWASSDEPDRAVDELRAAIRLAPQNAAYRYQLGVCLQAQRRYEAASAVYRGCLEIDPKIGVVWCNWGIVLSEMGNCSDAITCFRRMLELEPNSPDGNFNLGVLLAGAWEHGKAVEHFEKAIKARPAWPAAHLWMGKSLYVLGDIRSAVACYRKALRYAPDSAEAHWALGLAHLMRGEYVAGWREYEWRWKWDKFPSVRRNFVKPQWQGEPLKGRTILLHAEQGFGDTIQFARYVPLVAEAGGRVVLEVPNALTRLLADFSGVAECIPLGEVLPEFDLHCPLMSLPLAFRTTVATIPRPVVPAISSVSECSSVRQVKRVGLVWAGGQGHQWNSQRSLSLKYFSPLCQIESAIEFVSLQKGPAAEQLGEFPVNLLDGVEFARDFADTAAVIAELDLVISVDTSVAHLAGSMGKPVWILLPEAPDWRWGSEGEQTPWYPTARFFRASREAAWEDVMGHVADELDLWCKML